MDRTWPCLPQYNVEWVERNNKYKWSEWQSLSLFHSSPPTPPAHFTSPVIPLIDWIDRQKKSSFFRYVFPSIFSFQSSCLTDLFCLSQYVRVRCVNIYPKTKCTSLVNFIRFLFIHKYVIVVLVHINASLVPEIRNERRQYKDRSN